MNLLRADVGTEIAPAPRSSSFWFSSFAIALGLSVIFGFLNFLREPPSGDFHGEWAALVFFAIGAIAVTPAVPRRFPVNPWFFVVALSLVGLSAIHLAADSSAYAQKLLFLLAYVAMALLAALVGQGIRHAGLTRETVQRIAWALVIAGVINSCSQILQALQLGEAFAPFVLRLVETVCRPYGNVGQLNQASTLAWLAIASLLYLNGVGRLTSRWAILPLVLLLLGSALTASRMAWLLLGFTVALVLFLPAWPVPSAAARRSVAAMLIGGFFAASYGAGFTLAGVNPDCTAGLQRLTDHQEGGLLVRLELWRQAIQVWLTSPWVGVGALNFLPTVYAIESLDVHHPLDTYAHNAIFQILAEFGLLGVGVLGTALLIWLRKLIAGRRNLQEVDAILILWLGLIGIHAMLEFPLWYTYFLMLFCLSLGLIVRADWSRRSPRMPLRGPMAGLAAILFGGAVVVFVDYRSLDRLFWLEDQRAAFSAAPTAEVRELIGGAARDVKLFRIQADHLQGLSEAITSDDLQRKIADAERLLSTSPQPIVAVRRIALAILDGDEETARLHLRRLFVFFPRHAEMFAQTLRSFAVNRPDEFAALAPLLEEELARRPQPRW